MCGRRRGRYFLFIKIGGKINRLNCMFLWFIILFVMDAIMNNLIFQ